MSTGYCPVECNTFTKYITFLSIAKFISSTSRTGNYIVRFRCIDEQDKSFAMGMAMTIFGLFGSIPYPLIFGAIADAACLIWEESCGGKGNCWLYDSEKFRHYLHGAAFTFMTIGSVFDIFVIYFSKSMKNLYDDEDVEEDANRAAATDATLSPLALSPLALQDSRRSSHQHRADSDDDNDAGEKYELQASKNPVSSSTVSDAPEATGVNRDQTETGNDSTQPPLPPPYEVANESSTL